MVGTNHSALGVDKWLSNTLILEADVMHSRPGALFGTPSIAAIVGSTNRLGGTFLGSLRLQNKENKEMIEDVKGIVRERIEAWYLSQKKLPENILYYRDGVSDSQYNAVKNEELREIYKGFNLFAEQLQARSMKPPQVNLTAIVVTKRHNTRFFPGTPEIKEPKQGNCAPSTLVEQGVTSPYFTEFFLQSHFGLQGTAKPAKYFVLQNDIQGMTVDELQDLTNRLNHAYARATKGVSYAMPAYYADRLCERGRCYIREFLVPSKEDREEQDSRRR
ncbi:stem cell self-renewal protein Piwi [Bimuria novae-zelandiae CBS 107.79]|uniref:Stem cell self-renewal protein Piwi n=1 Tax=Bimuria novae-zelandiae CBS 107.79 TaxID=1447943 RepID=A0A6A5V664_9PLEO|nr:stem cell self-renewal protein Piwi [Bimuria novae-zelandiae CBS 107.79]